jgi:CheY-like chemotaxis protein
MVTSSDILKADILIVDDQEANVSLLEEMLRGAGYLSVASTRDPRQVCELYRRRRYSLIVLDLLMPGLDGFAVMEGLKAIETQGYLPVLVLTAQPSHKVRALKAGAKDFVSKPFDLVEVLLRVHNLLEVRLLLSAVKVLNSLLPICSYCRRIRDGKNYWQSVERYIAQHTDSKFSHSICPDCLGQQRLELEQFRVGHARARSSQPASNP